MLCKKGHLLADYTDALFTGSQNNLLVFRKYLWTIQVFIFETVFRNSLQLIISSIFTFLTFASRSERNATFSYSPSALRVPKGFRAPGLRPKKCRAPGLQDGKFGALRLYCFTLRLHLAKNSSFVRASSRERLWAPASTTKNFWLHGSEDPPPPFATLLCVTYGLTCSRLSDSRDGERRTRLRA